MTSMKSLSLTVSILVLTTGCATKYGTVLPQADGSYQVVSAQKAKHQALEGVKLEAERTCKKATGNKQFVSLDAQSEFTGVTIDRGEGGTTRSVIAGALEFAAKLENDTNYETRMTFRCVADGPQTYSPAPVTAAAAATAYSPLPVASAQAPSSVASPVSPARTADRSKIDDIMRRASAENK